MRSRELYDNTRNALTSFLYFQLGDTTNHRVERVQSGRICSIKGQHRAILRIRGMFSLDKFAVLITIVEDAIRGERISVDGSYDQPSFSATVIRL